MSGDSNQLWQQCVGQLMAEGQCADCAVVRLRGGEVLAAAEGGVLQHLSPREVRLLLDTSRDNRRRLQTHGLSLGGVPVAVLRDQLTAAGGAVQLSMDLRTKRQPSQGVAVYRTRTHLLLLMGRHGVGGGLLHHRAHQMALNLHHAGA
ncbi:profilin-1-like [Engraulis encrasicolus]|uniref:profilin-1-like n=1 Tax=Engraulis encrasicolus TaxID=184585 RepID=UPI002FD21034